MFSFLASLFLAYLALVLFERRPPGSSRLLWVAIAVGVGIFLPTLVAVGIAALAGSLLGGH